MAMDITLTDGGIETRIIYEFKCPICDFEAYKLFSNQAGRDILRRIYPSYDAGRHAARRCNHPRRCRDLSNSAALI